MNKVKSFLRLVVITAVVIGLGTASVSLSDSIVKASEVKQAQKVKAAQVASDTKSLNTLVQNFSQYDTNVGIVVTDTSDGASATINANEQFVSASLYKLFVAYSVYKKIDDGNLSPNKTINTVDTDDGTTSTNTIEGCLNLMITISDNACGDALGTLDNWKNLDSFLTSQGYTQTMLNNYNSDGSLKGDKQTTAHDVALLLQRLYNGTLISKASTTDFLSLLKQQTINDRLPTGLPTGTIIAHKTGDLYGYLHDAGIIYSAKKNVIVVMLTGDWDVPQDQGIPLFTQLASDVWSYMQE